MYVYKLLHSAMFANFVDQNYKQMWNSLLTLHYMNDDRENVKIVSHNYFTEIHVLQRCIRVNRMFIISTLKGILQYLVVKVVRHAWKIC